MKKVIIPNCEDQPTTSNGPKCSVDCNEPELASHREDLRSEMAVDNRVTVHPNTVTVPEEVTCKEMVQQVDQRFELEAEESLGAPQFVPDGNIADCLVCLTEPPTIPFIPCGHRHTCASCAKKIFESNQRCCLTCREQIQHCYRIWT